MTSVLLVFRCQYHDWCTALVLAWTMFDSGKHL